MINEKNHSRMTHQQIQRLRNLAALIFLGGLMGAIGLLALPVVLDTGLDFFEIQNAESMAMVNTPSAQASPLIAFVIFVFYLGPHAIGALATRYIAAMMIPEDWGIWRGITDTLALGATIATLGMTAMFTYLLIYADTLSERDLYIELTGLWTEIYHFLLALSLLFSGAAAFAARMTPRWHASLAILVGGVGFVMVFAFFDTKTFSTFLRGTLHLALWVTFWIVSAAYFLVVAQANEVLLRATTMTNPAMQPTAPDDERTTAIDRLL